MCRSLGNNELGEFNNEIGNEKRGLILLYYISRTMYRNKQKYRKDIYNNIL